jgi:hypothetical protein
VHPEHRVITCHGGAPGWERPGDAIAKHPGVAGEKIDLVSDLQSERIARVFHAQVLQHEAGCPPAPLDQMTDRLHVSALAVGRGERLRRSMRGAGEGQGAGLGPQQMKVRFEDMAHDKLRARLERALDRRDGVCDVAAQLM